MVSSLGVTSAARVSENEAVDFLISAHSLAAQAKQELSRLYGWLP